MNSREIRLAARPHGWPTAETFAVATRALPEPAEGEVLVRNLFLSVDPYMRGRMNDARSYAPPFALGEPLGGGAVGEVVASRAAGLAAGDLVLSQLGWREAFVAPAAAVRRVDRDVPSPSLHLGALGMPGLTAWVGLRLVGAAAGERVWVSAAAGAVGSVAVQLAHRWGCEVIASAGGPAKVDLARALGARAAFDHRAGDLRGQLAAAAPDGLDVFFDNVGGDHLEAALGALRVHGRVAACGAIAQYNEAEPPPGPRNLALVIGKRLTIRGFLVTDHAAEQAAYLAEALPLVRAGALRCPETIVEGLDQAPAALLAMLRGESVGKMIVRVG